MNMIFFYNSVNRNILNNSSIKEKKPIKIRLLFIITIFGIMLVLSSGCTENPLIPAPKPMLEAQVISSSPDFDLVNYQIIDKVTIEVSNIGEGTATECEVSVVVKTSNETVLATESVYFGTIGPGGKKIQDVFIPITLGGLAQIILDLKSGELNLIHETAISFL
jgi:hypothetical protein